MTPEQYIALMGELGIDRGQLGSGFIFDPTTLHAEKTPVYLSKDARKFRPSELEDLSWMNPHNTKRRAESIKKAWASMDKDKYARCVAKNRAKGKLCRGMTKSNFVRAKY